MSDQYVNAAKERMGAIERLLKGLPGIRGYVDKELRRDADKRLREMIAGQLEDVKQSLYQVQRQFLEGKGLMWMDNVDNSIQKLQILIDRIKTASYPLSTICCLLACAAAILGGARNFGAVGWGVHAGFAIALIAANAVALPIQYRLLKRNGALVNELEVELEAVVKDMEAKGQMPAVMPWQS